MHCKCGSISDLSKGFAKYVIYAGVIYLVITKLFHVTSYNNTALWITCLSTALVMLLDNLSAPCQIHYRTLPLTNPIIPTVDTAPKYNENNNFEIHDDNMSYKPNFYEAGGDPPHPLTSDLPLPMQSASSGGSSLDNFYEPPLSQQNTEQSLYHKF
jgi:hypothetical protein